MSQKKLFNSLYASLMLIPIFILLLSNLPVVYKDGFVLSANSLFSLLSWTSNSMFYLPIVSFCELFNYDSALIPTLFSYWLTISCLFLLFDMLMFVVRWARSKISSLYSKND